MKLDLNTNLREDQFLFPKGREDNSANNEIIDKLNEVGIYTVKDLISYDKTKISGSYFPYFVKVLSDVLKYKYLKEKLPNDVILKFKYQVGKDSINDDYPIAEVIASDLKKLGIGNLFQPIRHLGDDLKRHINFEELDSISMEEILKLDIFKYKDFYVYGDVNFRDFYLEYIEEQKTKGTLEINDINTKLEYDDFLHSNVNMDSKIRYLNGKKIYTVKDLIYCDQSQLPASNLQFYQALIQVLRYKYLGEELPNDVILEKKYLVDACGRGKDVKELRKDLVKLGFGLSSRREKHNFLYQRGQDGFNFISMKEVLVSDDIFKALAKEKGFAFRNFYLKYIGYMEKQNKKEEPEKEQSPKVALEYLKGQLQALTLTRDNLDKQIEELQEQLALIEGGKRNGRH